MKIRNISNIFSYDMSATLVLIPSWLVWAEIECTVPVAYFLSKKGTWTSLNQFSKAGNMHYELCVLIYTVLRPNLVAFFWMFVTAAMLVCYSLVSPRLIQWSKCWFLLIFINTDFIHEFCWHLIVKFSYLQKSWWILYYILKYV